MSVRRRVGAALAVLCLGSIMAACVAAKEPAPPAPQLPPPPPDLGPPANSPTLSSPTNIVTGLSNPWDLAFLPGDANKFFYTQRFGPVRLHTVSPPVDVLIAQPGDVLTSGESGMNGIAVDPSYASNKFIYTYYATANDNRIVRWHVNITETGTDGSTIIASGIPESNMHDGGRIKFGPDGKLWFTTGDASTGPLPQDLSQLGGKTARINTNGTTPGDNPFVGQPGIDDRIYTYGHRNPQGLAFRPGDGVPYAAEHGPNINDEVNQLVAGGNGGWDPNTNGTYDQSVPMTDLQKFPNAMIPAWRSGDSFTLAPSGATFLDGPQWKSWDGALLVVFLKDSKARVMFLDGNGNVSFATPILDNGVRLRSAVQGPDGNLYITTDAGGGNDVIYKVVPS